MIKKNVAIICGGYSGEKDISMQSALFVKENLDKSKYVGYPIVIARDRWFFVDEIGVKFDIDRNDFSIDTGFSKINIDLVFNIIHGDPGENGKMQAYFEMLGIPSTSSNSVVSALTFNKAYCNKVVSGLGVQVADELYFSKGDDIDLDQVVQVVGLPCFVKPNAGGSSIGMSKVNKADELPSAIETAFKEDGQILIESFVKGREITCGVINSKGKFYVLPLCEVISKKEFFDYEAKYNPELSSEVIPAEVDEIVEEDIKATSVFLYKKLNCSGVVRMDYIVAEDGIYFLEVNTIPGMSKNSIVPKMAKEFGFTYTELLNMILGEAN